MIIFLYVSVSGLLDLRDFHLTDSLIKAKLFFLKYFLICTVLAVSCFAFVLLVLILQVIYVQQKFKYLRCGNYPVGSKSLQIILDLKGVTSTRPRVRDCRLILWNMICERSNEKCFCFNIMCGNGCLNLWRLFTLSVHKEGGAKEKFSFCLKMHGSGLLA